MWPNGDYGSLAFYMKTTQTGTRLSVLTTAVQHYDRNAYVTGVDWHLLTPDGKLKLMARPRSDLDGVKAVYGALWTSSTPSAGCANASASTTLTST